MAAETSQIESFVTYLIDHHLIDNSSESETLSKFLQQFEAFEEQVQTESMNGSIANDEDSILMFETKAIFTLADFLKTLTPNEYYDIAQKFYNQWAETDMKKPYSALEKVIKIRQKLDRNQALNAFSKWKQENQFFALMEENEQLKEYIHILTKENEALTQERNILELQTKKRNQISVNNIQPLRQSRKFSSERQQRSASKSNTLTQTLTQFHETGDAPIHERLHREAYKKNQQQVIYDVLKQRDELKNCTFQPQISTPTTNDQLRCSQQREDPYLYERLSKSTKKFNPELMQLQKEQEELRDCTFKPETNHRSKMIAEQVQQDYQDKERFYDRLYREGENKDKFIKGLQRLKEQAEVNQCTFQPELITKNHNSSVISSARKSHPNPQNEDPFTRLHQDSEAKQRALVRKGSEHDQKFKESHPFQPQRVTKSRENQGPRETSKQRAERMYQQWKQKEDKIKAKREEMLKEEEKMHKLTLVAKKGNQSQTSFKHDQSVDQTDTQSLASSTQTRSTHERLYIQSKDKNRKQEELREKVFKEQGYIFAPQTNPNSKMEASQKSVIDRNQEFIQKKENHIKEIAEKTKCEFKPERVTTKSKLAQQYNQINDQENIVDKLYSKGVEIENKKEKIRQEMSIDKNCTFRPQLAKKTEKILRDSSQSRMNKSIQSRTGQQSYRPQEESLPFGNRSLNH